MTGTIKKLARDKGFGFILGADDVEYFFHRSSCQTRFESLGEDDHVTFEVGSSSKGPRAEDVARAR